MIVIINIVALSTYSNLIGSWTTHLDRLMKICPLKLSTYLGSFTYYISHITFHILHFQLITFDYEGGRWVLALDYVIKNKSILHKFLLYFEQSLSQIFKIF